MIGNKHSYRVLIHVFTGEWTIYRTRYLKICAETRVMGFMDMDMDMDMTVDVASGFYTQAVEAG